MLWASFQIEVAVVIHWERINNVLSAFGPIGRQVFCTFSPLKLKALNWIVDMGGQVGCQAIGRIVDWASTPIRRE